MEPDDHVLTEVFVGDVRFVPADRVAELRAALKPFADYADPRRTFKAEAQDTPGSPCAKPQLTMGHCYAAADALKTISAEVVEPVTPPSKADLPYDAVMGAPRKPNMPDVVYGLCGTADRAEQRGCSRPIMWNAACPESLPKLCINCVAKLAMKKPDCRIMLPSGRDELFTHDTSAD